MLTVSQDLSEGRRQERISHVASPCRLGHLTARCLGSKDRIPRENQAEAGLPLLPQPRKPRNLTSAMHEPWKTRSSSRGGDKDSTFAWGARQVSRKARRAGGKYCFSHLCKIVRHRKINPRWSTPFRPCSLWQVSSSPCLITHDQADSSLQ